jgi:streptogramin lyase
MKTAAGHAYTVVEYPAPTADSVPHIIAIDAQDHVWFSGSGGRFAKNFIDVPPQSIVARLDQKGSISEWKLSEEGTSPMGIAFDGARPVGRGRLANRITRMRRDGGADHFALPNAWPTGLAVDRRTRGYGTYAIASASSIPRKGASASSSFPRRTRVPPASPQRRTG